MSTHNHLLVSSATGGPTGRGSLLSSEASAIGMGITLHGFGQTPGGTPAHTPRQPASPASPDSARLRRNSIPGVARAASSSSSSDRKPSLRASPSLSPAPHGHGGANGHGGNSLGVGAGNASSPNSPILFSQSSRNRPPDLALALYPSTGQGQTQPLMGNGADSRRGSARTLHITSSHAQPPSPSPASPPPPPYAPNAAASATASAAAGAASYPLYKVRWYGLFVLSWLILINSELWICYAPIADLSSKFYKVGNTSINGFSIVFLAMYGPGYIIGLWAIDRFGTRKSLLVGALVQALGAWIRVMGIKNDHEASEGGYGVAMFGQSLAAIAGPVLNIMPCRYAVEYFPSSTLSIATTIAVISNPVGTAVGQFVPTLLVDESGGMTSLLIGSAVFASIGCVLMIWFPDAQQDLKTIALALPAGSVTAMAAGGPEVSAEVFAAAKLRPSPNSVYTLKIVELLGSHLAAARPEAVAAAAAVAAGGWSWARFQSTFPLVPHCLSLLRNWSFMMLFLGYFVGVGIANAFVTLIQQLIEPCGYTKDDAGSYGALIILFGMIGSAIASVLLDKGRKRIEEKPHPLLTAGSLRALSAADASIVHTQLTSIHPSLYHPHLVSIFYRNVLRVFLVLSIAAVLFTLLVLRPNQGLLLGVAFASTGFAVMPLLPILVLLAADCAPNVPEDASTGMLMAGSNYGGIVMISIFSALIEGSSKTYSTVFTSSSICIFVMLLACVVTIIAGYDYRAKVSSLIAYGVSADAEPDACAQQGNGNGAAGVPLSITAQSAAAAASVGADGSVVALGAFQKQHTASQLSPSGGGLNDKTSPRTQHGPVTVHIHAPPVDSPTVAPANPAHDDNAEGDALA